MTTILQISAAPYEGGCDIFGLGDDSNVYFWDPKTAQWELNITK